MISEFLVGELHLGIMRRCKWEPYLYQTHAHLQLPPPTPPKKTYGPKLIPERQSSKTHGQL